MEDVAKGDGRAVLLEGQAGIGKTTILSQIADTARQMGFRVLPAAADDFEQQVPFATMARCLGMYQPSADPDVSAIADLLSPKVTAEAPTGSSRLEFVFTEAVLALIDRWCAQGPVAILLDDLQ